MGRTTRPLLLATDVVPCGAGRRGTSWSRASSKSSHSLTCAAFTRPLHLFSVALPSLAFCLVSSLTPLAFSLVFFLVPLRCFFLPATSDLQAHDTGKTISERRGQWALSPRVRTDAACVRAAAALPLKGRVHRDPAQVLWPLLLLQMLYLL